MEFTFLFGSILLKFIIISISFLGNKSFRELLKSLLQYFLKSFCILSSKSLDEEQVLNL